VSLPPVSFTHSLCGNFNGTLLEYTDFSIIERCPRNHYFGLEASATIFERFPMMLGVAPVSSCTWFNVVSRRQIGNPCLR
jgi:hypothetical protein